MLVVVASHHDLAARAIVERWAAYGAALLRCEDLSMPGWRHRAGVTPSTVDRDSTAVVDGRVVAIDDITGVLTRRAYVAEQELGHVVRADRPYVAAEMTSFLVAWLSRLPCPVLNRPTPPCLAGPSWWPEHWVHAAARVGLRVRPVRRRAIRSSGKLVPATPAITGAIIVGSRCLGTVHPVLAAGARRLADVAGVDLLEVQFDGAGDDAEFLGANLWPDFDAPEVADAILEYLLGGGR